MLVGRAELWMSPCGSKFGSATLLKRGGQTPADTVTVTALLDDFSSLKLLLLEKASMYTPINTNPDAHHTHTLNTKHTHTHTVQQPAQNNILTKPPPTQPHYTHK